MSRHVLLLLAAVIGGLTPAVAGDVVFRSDVSLVRVDAQVVDRNHRTITGLSISDFVLREEGQPLPIRNFESDPMPVDVLFLLDVSASMRPHVERIASAAHDAFRVLGPRDRIAIMVFDRSSRLRMPFRDDPVQAEREFESLLRQESFDGGTDITRGLLDAAKYIGREGRPDARRAIVILTDDRTERDRDEERVSRALTSADAVLSALIAPDAMGDRGRWPGSHGGGTWPGGSSGGPLGGIILGRRGPYGGRGPVMPRTQSAGTEEIARTSGGDSMPVDDSSALETTLARIRQRYALHFYLPPGVKPGEERSIEVSLADAARRRYPDADVHYRRVYLAPNGSGEAVVASANPPAESATQPRLKRRPAVNGPVDSGPSIGAPAAQQPETAAPPVPRQEGGWRRVEEPAAAPPAKPAQQPAPAPEPRQGGWRKVGPGEQP